jgi:hypothetical protein
LVISPSTLNNLHYWTFLLQTTYIACLFPCLVEAKAIIRNLVLRMYFFPCRFYLRICKRNSLLQRWATLSFGWNLLLTQYLAWTYILASSGLVCFTAYCWYFLTELWSCLCVQTWMVQEKLKESQYQITPWRVESSNNTSGPGQSPSHPPGNALVASVWLYNALSFTRWVRAYSNSPHFQSQPSLDIVPQQAYSHAQSPISSPVRTRRDWDLLANENREVIPTEVASTNTEHDNAGRTSPPSRLLLFY